MNNNSITVNLIWKFLERILAQLVSFIVSLILARLLLPEDYGVVSIVMVFITFAEVFFGKGLGSSLMQKKDSDEIDYSSVFFFNIAISLIIYIILFSISSFVANFYDKIILKSVLRVLAITIFFEAIKSVQLAYISKKMEFKKFFYATLIGTLISGIVGVILAYTGFGVWALVAQCFINPFMDTVILALTIKWKPVLKFSVSKIIKLWSFGWKLLFEGIAASIETQFRSLLIGRIYTVGDLAYYQKGQNLPSLLTNNIASSFYEVLFPAMSNIQDNKEGVLELLRKTVRLLSFFLFPLSFGLLITSDTVVTILFTERWIGIVPYVKLFCVYQIINISISPRQIALTAVGRSDIFLRQNIIPRIIGIVYLVLFYKKSIYHIAISVIIPITLCMIYSCISAVKINKYSIIEQFRDFIVPLLFSLIMLCGVYLIKMLVINIIRNNYLSILIQVGIGIILYVMLNMTFKPICYLEAKKYVKNIFSRIRNT